MRKEAAHRHKEPVGVNIVWLQREMGYGTQFRHGNAALRWLQKFMRNAPHSNAYWLEAQYNRFLGFKIQQFPGDKNEPRKMLYSAY